MDCGDPDIGPLIEWLFTHIKNILAVILTHEHADHCAGLNSLERYCSQACMTGIRGNKQNFSLYIDEIPVFNVGIPVNLIHDNETIKFNGNSFTFIV